MSPKQIIGTKPWTYDRYIFWTFLHSLLTSTTRIFTHDWIFQDIPDKSWTRINQDLLPVSISWSLIFLPGIRWLRGDTPLDISRFRWLRASVFGSLTTFLAWTSEDNDRLSNGFGGTPIVTQTCIYLSIYLSIYIYICIYISTCTVKLCNVYIYIHIHVYIYVYVYVYVYIYI